MSFYVIEVKDAGHDCLLNESYPDKPDNKVSYLADTDTVTVARVAYLWPTSGVYSGVNALATSLTLHGQANLTANRLNHAHVISPSLSGTQSRIIMRLAF